VSGTLEAVAAAVDGLRTTLETERRALAGAWTDERGASFDAEIAARIIGDARLLAAAMRDFDAIASRALDAATRTLSDGGGRFAR
jgi:hypothetical protein